MKFYWCTNVKNEICTLQQWYSNTAANFLGRSLSINIQREIKANKIVVGNSWIIDGVDDSKLSELDKAKRIAENVGKYVKFVTITGHTFDMETPNDIVSAALDRIGIGYDRREHLILLYASRYSKDTQKREGILHESTKAQIGDTTYLIDVNLRRLGFAAPDVCFMEMTEAMAKYDLCYDEATDDEYWKNWL